MPTNDRTLLLAPNFRLAEFLHNDDPIPPYWAVINLAKLAQRLQVLRDFFGLPITITSGFRSQEHNAAVGGKPESQHLLGNAADIIVVGMEAHEVQDHLKNWSGGMGLAVHYTHLDIRPTRARWTYPDGQ